ncbi:hypothetical protein [Mobilicoccus caccae]|uniref:Glycosyltransferase involved in cell wall biosynthesis n=1 Tax=Mobilicoccus caccae TaxID=1859295 RepID=A0ABQ6IL61_9MICO|nr:hypothetical protein [Mobilicoccus caccae]GMA38648.1 hypothetical protein GCM10025883_06930 [Mobilicoccus caccae]
MNAVSAGAGLRGRVLARIPRGAKQQVKTGLVDLRRQAPASLVRTAEKRAGRVVATPQLLDRAAQARPTPPQTPTRLWVGPANFAGQGDAWARAVERHLGDPEVGATSMSVAGPIRFPVDYEVEPEVFRDLAWQREQLTALRGWTHVLVEAERPVTGTLFADCAAEARALERLGLLVAHLSHGSDIRAPDVHAATHPHSPFTDPSDPRVVRLQRLTDRNGPYLRESGRPSFVSTPDLLDHAPDAIWCPVVVDADLWATDTTPLYRDRPIVVHAPSNGWLKGSDLIDPLMTELHEAGVVEYRTLRGLDRAGMLREYREADIVLDQFVLDLYGVAAAEAMAAGRVVVASVGESVRARVREACGEEVPIVEAGPDDLVEVIHGILDDRDAARTTAAAGPGFVRRVHDGTRSAQALATFLG